MEVAQLIMEIVAHAEILQAEVQRIDLDVKHLEDASKRYSSDPAVFLCPQRQLKKVRQAKEATLKEIKAHLQCYQLHQDASTSLLGKLNAAAADPTAAAATNGSASARSSRPGSSGKGCPTRGGGNGGGGYSANSSITNSSRLGAAPAPNAGRVGSANRGNGMQQQQQLSKRNLRENSNGNALGSPIVPL